MDKKSKIGLGLIIPGVILNIIGMYVIPIFFDKLGFKISVLGMFLVLIALFVLKEKDK